MYIYSGDLSDWYQQDATNARWTCLGCHKQYYDKSTTIRHIQMTHTESEKVYCELCNKCFKNDVSLRQHTRVFHK